MTNYKRIPKYVPVPRIASFRIFYLVFKEFNVKVKYSRFTDQPVFHTSNQRLCLWIPQLILYVYSQRCFFFFYILGIMTFFVMMKFNSDGWSKCKDELLSIWWYYIHIYLYTKACSLDPNAWYTLCSTLCKESKIHYYIVFTR